MRPQSIAPPDTYITWLWHYPLNFRHSWKRFAFFFCLTALVFIHIKLVEYAIIGIQTCRTDDPFEQQVGIDAAQLLNSLIPDEETRKKAMRREVIVQKGCRGKPYIAL